MPFGLLDYLQGPAPDSTAYEIGSGVGLAAGVLLPGPRIRGFGNIGGGSTSASRALTQAENYLGPGYREIAPGVFRSADDTRQFRMTIDDLTDPRQGTHVHFEAIGSDGRVIIENSHVYIIP